MNSNKVRYAASVASLLLTFAASALELTEGVPANAILGPSGRLGPEEMAGLNSAQQAAMVFRQNVGRHAGASCGSHSHAAIQVNAAEVPSPMPHVRLFQVLGQFQCFSLKSAETRKP